MALKAKDIVKYSEKRILHKHQQGVQNQSEINDKMMCVSRFLE